MSAAGFPRERVARKLSQGLEQLALSQQADPVADAPSAGTATVAPPRHGPANLLTDGSVQAALVDYLALLQRWNRAYNLSAVRDPEAMVAVHVLDSLSLLPYLEGPLVLDVGSGAGLPGIPLALCRPDLTVTLLDSNGKKTRFLNQVRLELGMGSLVVEQQRIQDYRPGHGFNTITSRAYARLDTFVDQTAHLLAPRGVLLAMKANIDLPAETAELDPAHVPEVLPLSVPGLDARRTLVRLRRRSGN